MTRVAVLGSTGSVGSQALEVIDSISSLSLVAIGCRRNSAKLLEQARRYRPETVLCQENDVEYEGKCVVGAQCFADFASSRDYDVLVVAVGGLAGLLPTIYALRRNKRVALANKETLVVGAHFVKQQLVSGGELLPVDSEHCAIHQCLASCAKEEIGEIILTASGGALRDMPLCRLHEATPAEVLAHPNWQMGDHITVDCATMVNKGYEVLEACALFDVDVSQVSALLHRQSVVHSLVRFVDNSYMAQLAVGDMRLPIQYALLYPKRTRSLVEPLDLSKPLTFEAIDSARYPSYELVRSVYCDQAKRVALYAADEYAVQAFLDGHIPFGAIHTILEHTAARFGGALSRVEDVFACRDEALVVAKEVKL